VPLLPSPAVLRACDVLELLAGHPGESLSVSELARRLEMPRATCHSVLLALAARGWVVRHDADLSYSIGPGCIAIGDAARAARPVVARVERIAEKLARATRSCVAVLTRDRDELSVAEVFDHGPAFGMRARRGETIPLVPPFGAVFIAWEGETGIARWLARAAVELGPSETRRYREALAALRRRGYSVTVATPVSPALSELLGEMVGEPGGSSRLRRRDQLIRELAKTEYLRSELGPGRTLRVSQMSAPVFDRDGRVVTALMLLGPDNEIRAAEIESLGTRLLKAAQDATRRLGGRAGERSAPERASSGPLATRRGRPRPARTSRS